MQEQPHVVFNGSGLLLRALNKNNKIISIPTDKQRHRTLTPKMRRKVLIHTGHIHIQLMQINIGQQGRHHAPLNSAQFRYIEIGTI